MFARVKQQSHGRSGTCEASDRGTQGGRLTSSPWLRYVYASRRISRSASAAGPARSAACVRNTCSNGSGNYVPPVHRPWLGLSGDHPLFVRASTGRVETTRGAVLRRVVRSLQQNGSDAWLRGGNREVTRFETGEILFRCWGSVRPPGEAQLRRLVCSRRASIDVTGHRNRISYRETVGSQPPSVLAAAASQGVGLGQAASTWMPTTSPR